MPEGLFRYRLDIAYVGTGFGGWQRQPNADTVQARVEAALSKLVGESVAVVGASRTDAGVHARAQVAHVDLSRPFSNKGLVFGTNHHLPPAIRILAAGVAPEGFHARFSATAKEYAYRVRPGRFVPPDLAPFVLAVPDRLDLERLQAATLLLPGRHDFSCFALAGGSHRSPVRTLFRAAWEEEAAGSHAAHRRRRLSARHGARARRHPARGRPRTALAGRLRGAARGRRARRGRTDRPGARAHSRTDRLPRRRTGRHAGPPGARCGSLDRMSEPPLRVEPGSLEETLLRQIDRSRLPRHVAIIMDGNGRWAGKRFLPRIEGHRAGVQAVRETVESAARLGVEVLTLYAFSIENWKRPRHEVWTLMNLLKEFLRREIRTLVDNDIRLHVLGRWRELDPSVVATLEEALAKTAAGRRMVFNIALNYSGRCEIVDACRKLVGRRGGGRTGRDRRGDDLGRARDRRAARSRPADSHLGRDAGVELPALADRLLRDLVTPTLWPDFRLQPPPRGDRRLPGARAPLRRHRRSAAARPRRAASPAMRLRDAGEAAAEETTPASPARNLRPELTRDERKPSMKRLLTAAIGVPAALFAVFRFPEWAFLLLLLVVFEWAALEFLAMVRPLAPQAPWRLLLVTAPLAAVALERGLASAGAAAHLDAHWLLRARGRDCDRAAGRGARSPAHRSNRRSRRPRSSAWGTLYFAAPVASLRPPAAARSVDLLPAARHRLARRHRRLLRRLGLGKAPPGTGRLARRSPGRARSPGW